MLATGIFIGLFPSALFIMGMMWTKDARRDKYTRELNEEKSIAASLCHEYRERCSKIEIEYDVLKVKYERLLKEGI